MTFMAPNTGPFNSIFAAMKKSVTHTPIVKITHNVTGDETLTDGTPVSIDVLFYKRDEIRNVEKYGQIVQNADAIMLIKDGGATPSKDDKITFNSETFRVDTKVPRYMGTTLFYTMYTLFRVS